MRGKTLLILSSHLLLLISCGHNKQAPAQPAIPKLQQPNTIIKPVKDTASNDEQNFRGTFEAFRKAVKRNNIDSVKQYIHFPLQTALQWTNDDLESRPVDKSAGLVTYSEFKEYYADIFHADVRRLLPGTVESELQEIDNQTNDDYYKTLQQVTDKGSKLYEAYLQYPEHNGRSESFFAFVFGRINGQYKVVAYYAKWPVKG